jgi:hypothetical protein
MGEITELAIAHIYGMNHQKKLFQEMLEAEQKRTGLGFIQYKRILELMEEYNGTSDENLH